MLPSSLLDLFAMFICSIRRNRRCLYRFCFVFEPKYLLKIKNQKSIRYFFSSSRHTTRVLIFDFHEIQNIERIQNLKNTNVSRNNNRNISTYCSSPANQSDGDHNRRQRRLVRADRDDELHEASRTPAWHAEEQQHEQRRRANQADAKAAVIQRTSFTIIVTQIIIKRFNQEDNEK